MLILFSSYYGFLGFTNISVRAWVRLSIASEFERRRGQTSLSSLVGQTMVGHRCALNTRWDQSCGASASSPMSYAQLQGRVKLTNMKRHLHLKKKVMKLDSHIILQLVDFNPPLEINRQPNTLPVRPRT